MWQGAESWWHTHHLLMLTWAFEIYLDILKYKMG
jgi:hypothetical protein